MSGDTVKNMGYVLYSPARVFDSPSYSRASLPALLIILMILTLLTGLLSYRVTNYEGVKDFQVELGVRQALKMMPGTSPEKEAELRDQIREQMYSPVTVISGYVSLVVGSLFSLTAALVLFWVYMMTAARFAGGEETPVAFQTGKGERIRKHRNSFLLSVYRYVPLVLAGLISVALILTRSRESFYNIASLEELTRKMSVNLSLYALLFEGSLPVPWETVLNILTSPFWWWSGWVSVEGMVRVWRIPPGKGTVIYIIWIALASLFQLILFSFTSRFTA